MWRGWLPVCGPQCFFSLFSDDQGQSPRSAKQRSYEGVKEDKGSNGQRTLQREVRVPTWEFDSYRFSIPLLACLVLFALVMLIFNQLHGADASAQHPPIVIPDCSQDLTSEAPHINVRAMAYCCHHLGLHCQDLEFRAGAAEWDGPSACNRYCRERPRPATRAKNALQVPRPLTGTHPTVFVPTTAFVSLPPFLDLFRLFVFFPTSPFLLLCLSLSLVALSLRSLSALSLALSLCLPRFRSLLPLPPSLPPSLPRSLSLSLSLSLALPPSLCSSVCLSIRLSVYLSACLCLSASLCRCLCLRVYLSVCLSVCLAGWLAVSLFVSLSVAVSVSVCLSLRLSRCLSVSLSVCPSDCLSVSQSVCLSVCLCVSLSLSLSLSVPLLR